MRRFIATQMSMACFRTTSFTSLVSLTPCSVKWYHIYWNVAVLERSFINIDEENIT